MSGDLHIDALTVRAGNKVLVDAVSASVRAGRLTGLLGPNGAGKSTLMRALLGLIKAEHGSIVFKGADLLAMSRRARAQVAAFVEQDAQTDASLTAEEAVLLGRIPFQPYWQSGPSANDHRVARNAMDTVGMTAFAQRSFASLSGGERQRLHIARAIAQQPKLLILDEPTNHLDIEAQLSILSLLREMAAQGKTILVALHDLNLAASFCDDLIIMNKGRIVAAGTPTDVLTPPLLRTVYGVTALLVPHPASGRPLIAFDTSAR